jgi:hypothetical protein
MSGDVSEAHARRTLSVPFIQTPFTAEALVEPVQSLIERSLTLRAVATAEQRSAAEGRAASQSLRDLSRQARSAAVDLVAAAPPLRAARANPESLG